MTKIDSIHSWRPEPGEVLVLSCPDKMRVEMKQQIITFMEEKYPGHKAMLLTDGLTLSTMTADELAAALL